MPVPQFEFSGNPTRGARRQALFDPMVIGEKEDEENIACFILDQHFVGRLGARPRRPVFDNLDFERDDRIERRSGDLWPITPVDRGIGEMEKKVERAGFHGVACQELVKQLGVFRPDAGQAQSCREERVEDGWAHRSRDLFVAIVRARACQRKRDRGGAASGAGSIPKGASTARAWHVRGDGAGFECVARQDRSIWFFVRRFHSRLLPLINGCAKLLTWKNYWRRFL